MFKEIEVFDVNKMIVGKAVRVTTFSTGVKKSQDAIIGSVNFESISVFGCRANGQPYEERITVDNVKTGKVQVELLYEVKTDEK